MNYEHPEKVSAKEDRVKFFITLALLILCCVFLVYNIKFFIDSHNNKKESYNKQDPSEYSTHTTGMVDTKFKDGIGLRIEFKAKNEYFEDVKKKFIEVMHEYTAKEFLGAYRAEALNKIRWKFYDYGNGVEVLNIWFEKPIEMILEMDNQIDTSPEFSMAKPDMN